MTHMAENLSGVIERITFHNPDSGFAVLRVQVKGHLDLVTIVGQIPAVQPGEYVEATGAWVQDRDHGTQFKAAQLQTTPPHTAKGIERYLGSGLIKGIGPHYARKIVEAFGERTLAVIDESPAFLKEVKGIGPRRIQQIRESWREQKAVRSIMIFLQSHGIGTARALRIYKTYGDQAIELVRSNPYRLATDIWGVGFQTADELAGKLGIDRASPLRARAAVHYELQELARQGHVGYPEAGVVAQTAQLTAIDPTIVSEAVDYERGQGAIVRDRVGADDWLYLEKLHWAEVGAADSLLRLCQGHHPLPTVQIDVALEWAEKKIGLELAETQRDAIRQATTQKVLVITGGPGVGKTTIVRGILEIFSAKRMHSVLCAPTGRASKRLSETTGREAKTIHRLLEFDPAIGTFKRTGERPLDLDLLVVDEVSMVDVALMNHLLQAVPPSASVILVGDVDQLPSVGPGRALADIIASRAVSVVRLTEIFRQAGESWIVRAAHRVNRGELPDSAPAGEGDFHFIECNTPEQILDRIITMVKERIPARFGLEPLRDIQVLTPMNRTFLGAQHLNTRLQEILNPVTSGPQVNRFGWTFHKGDKVIQMVNDYKKEVFNGDIGFVSAIDDGAQELVVSYDGRDVPYGFGELDELALAYALSIHKSQGSEYPAVVIPLHTQHYLMLQRNLLYTGIARGKKLVVVVGSRKALGIAVERRDTTRRYSALRWRLQGGKRSQGDHRFDNTI
jgi:exodeoxyribonuclease V alpha subunit